MFDKHKRRWSDTQAFRRWWRRHQGFRPPPPWYWRWVRDDLIADLEKCETPEAIETRLRKMVHRVRRERQFFDPHQQSLLFDDGADENLGREPSKPIQPGYANYWDPSVDVEA